MHISGTKAHYNSSVLQFVSSIPVETDDFAAFFENPKRSCVFPWRKKNLLWATKHLPREEKRGKLKKNNPFLLDAGGGGKRGEGRRWSQTAYFDFLRGGRGKESDSPPSPPIFKTRKPIFPLLLLLSCSISNIAWRKREGVRTWEVLFASPPHLFFSSLPFSLSYPPSKKMVKWQTTSGGFDGQKKGTILFAILSGGRNFSPVLFLSFIFTLSCGLYFFINQ